MADLFYYPPEGRSWPEAALDSLPMRKISPPVPRLNAPNKSVPVGS